MNQHSDFSKSPSVTQRLGLGTLADGEPTADPEILRAIYRHARNEDGKRVLFANDTTFARGWVNLDTEAARSLISSFVALDDAAERRHAWNIAASNLEAQPWNDLLGIDSPPIKLDVKIHGRKWGLRFRSLEPSLKGKEKLNEDLPPIPAQTNSAPTSVGSPTVDSPCSTAAAAAVGAPSPGPASATVDQSLSKSAPNASASSAAADALKSAGMPA